MAVSVAAVFEVRLPFAAVEMVGKNGGQVLHVTIPILWFIIRLNGMVVRTSKAAMMLVSKQTSAAR